MSRSILAGTSGIAILLAASAGLVMLVWTGLWALRRRRPRHVRRPAASDASSTDHLPHRTAREAASLASRPILLPDPSWGWWPISDGGLLVPPETGVDD